jgi:hypothetical protein
VGDLELFYEGEPQKFSTDFEERSNGTVRCAFQPNEVYNALNKRRNTLFEKKYET